MLHAKPMALAVALAVAGIAGQAHALQVSQSLNGVITVDGNIASDQTTPPSSSPISDYIYTGGRFFSPSFYYGDLPSATTNIRVLAGDGKEVSNRLTYVAVITNDSDHDVALNFNFFIGRGRISVDSSGATQPFSGNANLNAEITWGDTLLWKVTAGVSSTGTLDGDGQLVTSSTSDVFKTSSAAGFTFNASGDATYFYDPYAGHLDLGILGAGQERRLEYALEGIGFYQASEADANQYGYGGQAIVGAYDPFDFDGRPVDGEGNPLPGIQPVPEPETWALMGSGLGLLAAGAWRRRRRRG